MKHVVITVPLLTGFLVAACAQNARPPTTAQQAAERAEKASQEAQKAAQDARHEARIAQANNDVTQGKLTQARTEELTAEQRAHQASYRAAYFEQQNAAAVPRTGAAELQGAPPGHPGQAQTQFGATGQAQTQAGQGGQAGESKVVVVTAGLLFPTNGAELAKGAKPKLDEVAAALRAKPEANNVVVVGFTDDRGKEGFNKTLSEKRAHAVSAYLASRGVPKDRITTKGLGEANPVSSEKTVEGRAMNRRVEITIHPRPETAPSTH